MRLDKFLKVSRIIKRRTEAKNACLARCIAVNGRIAKAGDEIKIGDKLEIDFNVKLLEVKVINVPVKNIPVEKASSLYEIIREIKKEED